MADQMVTVHQLKLEYGEYIRGMKQAANAAAELAKARSTEAIADAKVMRQTEMYLAAVSRREATEARTAATIERLERQKAKAIENSTRAYRQQSQVVDKGLGVLQKAQKSAASVESQNAEIRRGVILAGQQFQDFAIQVAGGQSVMLAAAQQGSQLHYQLSTMTVGLRQFGAAFLRMVVNPITLGVAAFAGLAYALVDTETKMRGLNKLTTQFSLAGLNFNTKELQEFVKQMDALPGVSRKAALGIVGAFSGTEISQDLIKPALDQVKQLSVALGEDLPKSGEALAGWLRSPSSAVDELRKRFSAFRGEAGDTIKSMEEMGNISGAQRQLLETLAKAFKDVEEQLTPLQKSTRALGKSWEEANLFGGILTKSTEFLTSTLQGLANVIDVLNRKKLNFGDIFPNYDQYRKVMDAANQRPSFTGDRQNFLSRDARIDSFPQGNILPRGARIDEVPASTTAKQFDNINWNKLIEQGEKYNRVLNERSDLVKKIAASEKLLGEARLAGKPAAELAQAESAIAEQRKKLADLDAKSTKTKKESVSLENKMAVEMANANKNLIESALSLNAVEKTKVEQLREMLPLYAEQDAHVKSLVESQIRLYEETQRANALDEKRQENIAYMVDQQKRFNDILDKTPTGQSRKLAEEMQFLHDQFMKIRDSFPDMQAWADAYQEAYNTLLGSTKKTTDEISEFWKKAAENMQDAMSGFFFDIMQGELSDLAGNFKKTIDRMVSDLLASQLLNFLKDTATSGGFGSFIGGLFNANGNAFNQQGVMAFANGGIVNSATPFTFGKGRLGVMGEAGPEAILPLERGANGKLGVQGGGNVTVYNNFTISGPTDRRSQQQISAEVGSAVDRALRRNR